MTFTLWFINPIKNHYTDFSGRASRETFWMYTVVYFFLAIIISTTESLLGTVFISVMVSFGLLLPSLAITARRLHDTGLSGWWQLVGFIPMIGIFILLVLLARKSDTAANEFGNPVAVEVSSEEIPSMA